MLRMLLLALLARAAVAEPLTLHYRAYLAGAPIGDAAITVTVEEGAYRVEGSAASNGWLRGFTDWHNRFAASGTLDGVTRAATTFSYFERDGEDSRHVVVGDGRVRVTKNGKPRSETAAPPGMDVVSALFVAPRCDADQVLHTGRRVYQLSRLEREPGGCRYAVVDDDSDRFEIELVLERLGSLVVPRRITVHSWLTGWVERVEGPGGGAD